MKYKIIYQDEDVIKTKIISSKELNNEKLPDNVIEIKKDFFNSSLQFEKNIKDKELNTLFYELSLMLDSKILLDDALNILIKNKKDKRIIDFLETLQNSFSKSLNITTSLESFRISNLVKSFFQITQDSGNVALNIKSLSEIISENYVTKKEFKKILVYPFILVITFLFSLLGIFKFVVPKFEFIFLNNKMELPLSTKILFLTKDIFENYLLFFIFGLLIFILILMYLYKHNIIFRYQFDKILVNKIYIISDIYRLKTFYTYFIVLDILLKSKYEFNESLEKAKVLLNNKYLLDRITQIENLIKSGKNIKTAFESSGLFDDVALSLISTGEITNSLDEAIGEIKKVYKKRFEEKLSFFSLIIEPIFLIIMMSLIVWIVLAVFVPLWSMGDMLKV